MPAVLFDTNAISDLMRDHPPLLARIARHTDPITTCSVVVGEICYGLNRLPLGKKRTELEARALRVINTIKIEVVSEKIAESYGRLKASLEIQGLNLDDNDLWIAATALFHGSKLVTRDGIFARIPGLDIEDWSISPVSHQYPTGGP